jgi:ribosome-binding factor A
MAGHFRDRRVSTEIQREVNEILQRRVRDPRVQDVTITDVRITGDLSQATIYYSILSDLASDAEKTQKGLQKATGLIRKELGSRMKLYKVPELFFERDESVQYGNKIDEMLRNLNKDA